MSYKIEIRDRVAWPVVICDYCGRKIEIGTDGNAMWMEPIHTDRANGKLYDVTHTHKKCCRHYEAANPCETGDAWMAHELDFDLFAVAINCGHDPKRGKRLARMMAQFE